MHRFVSSFTCLLVFLLAASLSLPSQTAAAAPQVTYESIWYTPREVDFGPIGVGQTAPQKIVTITNEGNVPLASFAGGGLSSPFNVSQDCVISGGILPGHSCHYFITFNPSAAGVFNVTSSSITNLGPIDIKVHGQAIDGFPVADKTSIDFGAVHTGNTAQQIVTIRNAGLAPLTQFAGGGIAAPFNATQDCVITGGILPGKSCHYFITFQPTAGGPFSTVSSSIIQGTTVNINVQGFGRTLPLGSGQNATPLAIDFGPVGVGTASPVYSTTITNQSILTNISGFAGGGVSAPFNATQDCAAGVPAGGACHFFFTFSPTSPGPFSATSNVSDSVGPISIQLKGVGVVPSQVANPLSIDFGPQYLNSTSVITVSVSNSGLSPLTSWAGGGVSAPFNATQDCVIAGGLQPGNACTFYYEFHPTAFGIYDADSTVTTNAGSFTVHLHGESASMAIFLPIIIR